MKHKTGWVRTILLLVGLAIAGCVSDEDHDRPEIAVSNSLLAGVIKDLLGESTPVLLLAQPDMCPGHSDIRPGQVNDLRRCQVLLRLEFERSLDLKLLSVTNEGLHVAEVAVAGGLSEPDSYLAMCQQAADTLVSAGLLDRTLADRRLEQIGARILEQVSEHRVRLRSVQNVPVVASLHQERFCRWLGLNVVATFSGADMMPVSQIETAVRQGEKAGVKLVVANLPEGRRVADALAQRLGAKVVVFDNFPTLKHGHVAFDDLLETNINTLLEITKN